LLCRLAEGTNNDVHAASRAVMGTLKTTTRPRSDFTFSGRPIFRVFNGHRATGVVLRGDRVASPFGI